MNKSHTRITEETVKLVRCQWTNFNIFTISDIGKIYDRTIVGEIRGCTKKAERNTDNAKGSIRKIDHFFQDTGYAPKHRSKEVERESYRISMRKLPTFYRKVTYFLFKSSRHDFSCLHPVWNFGTLAAAITITLCGVTKDI